jgi:hypothetical protein
MSFESFLPLVVGATLQRLLEVLLLNWISLGNSA